MGTFIDVQVRSGQVQFQQILAVREMQGGRLEGGLLALEQKVGDLFAAERFKGQGVFEGASDFLRTVELAQRDDLLDVVGSIEPLVLKAATVDFGLLREA